MARVYGDQDLSTPALRGHVVGDVPEAKLSIREEATNGDPDITTNTRPPRPCDPGDGPQTADLILHSQTLREMRDSEHQYNKLLAAHVVSSSYANSVVVVQTLPRTRAQTPGDRFRHILRLRMGVPCAMPLAQCNCSAHAGPRQGEFVERVAEANGPDLLAAPHSPRSRCTACTAGAGGSG